MWSMNAGIHARMDGWTDEYMNGWMDNMDRWIDVCTVYLYGCMNGYMYTWMDGCMHVCMNECMNMMNACAIWIYCNMDILYMDISMYVCMSVCICVCMYVCMDGWIDACMH